jgi:hypothetical protein
MSLTTILLARTLTDTTSGPASARSHHRAVGNSPRHQRQPPYSPAPSPAASTDQELHVAAPFYRNVCRLSGL